MIKTKYICSKAELEAELTNAARIVNLAARLPEMLFNAEFKFFRCADVDDIFTITAATSLLSNVSSPPSVITALCIDPDYRLMDNDGFFGCVQFSSDVSPIDYGKLMMFTPTQQHTRLAPGSLAIESERLLIYDTSLQWCIYGERSTETAIFASKEESLVIKIDGIDTQFSQAMQPKWVGQPVDQVNLLRETASTYGCIWKI